MNETILIADDSETNRVLLKVILKNERVRILEAADGPGALKAAFAEKPDVVLLDIEMPGLDGHEVCRRLKAERTTKNATVVFISGRTNPADKIKGLELGAADYIAKPFDKGEILARVRNQLKIKRLNDTLLLANRKLYERKKALEADLEAAAQIQRSLLPKKRPDTDKIELAWRFFPCENIGGDIFNFHWLDRKHLCMFVLDVSGHGVPAAMVTVSVCQTLLPEAGVVRRRSEAEDETWEIVSPTEVFEVLDAEYPMERFDKYFTMAYVVLDVRSGTFEYSCAAHPMPVLVRSDGAVEHLSAGGPMIGFGGSVPFESGSGRLEPGDRLFLYTDGLVEHRDSNGRLFGEERMVRSLLNSRDLSLDGACEALFEELWKFEKKNRSEDDITLLAMERPEE